MNLKDMLREARQKRAPTVWRHLYESPEKRKLFFGDGMDPCGLWLPIVEAGICSKGAGGNFGGTEVFWILIVVVAPCGHVGLTKITAHFCGWPLIVCELNLREADLKEKTQEPS